MRKKMLLLVLISIMVGGMLTGCGAKDEPVDSEITAGMSEDPKGTEGKEDTAPVDKSTEKEPEAESVDISK